MRTWSDDFIALFVMPAALWAFVVVAVGMWVGGWA